MSGYLTHCPNCGADTVHVTLPADHAPFVCNNCARSWWASELHTDSREAWDTDVRSFAANPRVSNFLAGERTNAANRGTSVRPELLHELTVDQLNTVVDLTTPHTTRSRQAETLREQAQAALVALATPVDPPVLAPSTAGTD